MMITYTYICKGCDPSCKISVSADENSEMGIRCHDLTWTPKSACSLRVRPGKWELYSLIPGDLT